MSEDKQSNDVSVAIPEHTAVVLLDFLDKNLKGRWFKNRDECHSKALRDLRSILHEYLRSGDELEPEEYREMLCKATEAMSRRVDLKRLTLELALKWNAWGRQDNWIVPSAQSIVANVWRVKRLRIPDSEPELVEWVYQASNDLFGQDCWDEVEKLVTNLSLRERRWVKFSDIVHALYDVGKGKPPKIFPYPWTCED